MANLLQDLRYGIRVLISNRAFALISVLALALGIGANSSIFTVVNAVLLRALPFKESERLVIIHETVRRESVERRPASYPDFVDWRDQSQVFEQISAFDSSTFTLTGTDEPERVRGEWVSASYFPLLGIGALQGRTFLEEEDQTAAPRPVALIGHRLWQRRFGTDPALVGRTLKLNDEEYMVVGILPEGFNGITGDAEMWVPIAMYDSGSPDRSLQMRGRRWHEVIGRLKPSISLEQAQAEMDTIASRLAATYPDTNRERGVLVVAAHEEAVSDFRPALLVLFGAVGFVLLIACANVANLLLARAVSRQREIAIRTALGANRWRVMRQLITESMLLALLGGVFGLLLAIWGVDLLMAISPVTLPSYVSTSIDGRVVGFTMVVSLLTGVIFGLAPAMQASRVDLNESLKDSGRGSTGGTRHQRVRRLLVVSEIALALVLLIGAGLMIKSFQRLQAFNPGFKVDNLLTTRINLPQKRYSAAQVATFSRQLLERLEALPSIQSASLASDVPLGGNSSAYTATIEGLPEAEGHFRFYAHSVSEKFFDTLGIPVLKGRSFTPQDNADAPKVVIISDSMAGRYWPGEDAIGKRINTGGSGANASWASIVGVVGEVKYRTLIRDRNRDPDVYFPLLQQPDTGLAIALRTGGDPTTIVPAVQREVHSLDPSLPLFSTATMETLMGEETAPARFSALLLGAFAFIAIVLAAVGIYGIMAYSVTQRTHEIGIRMALGAESVDILKMVIKEGMALVAFGVGAGLAGALAVTRVLSSQLYSVSATDPATFGVVSLLLVAVALLSSYLPARRATRVDPIIALRHE